MVSGFETKLEELLAELGEEESAPAAPPVNVTFMQNKGSGEISEILDRVGIVEAYNRWANKGHIDPGGKVEGYKVRCPNPLHEDTRPSAWINTDDNLWTCRLCTGGDKYDIAAWHFGMPVPGYKNGKNFHELRERMAASLGYRVERSGGQTYVSPPETAPKVDSAPTEDTPEEIAPEESHAKVLPLFPKSLLDVEKREIELKWKPLAPAGTFLNAYMKQATIDDAPEEYHFWYGMLALASAVGREAALADAPPVYGNLFLCILGRTGSGKSKARYILNKLLHEALPYDHSDPFNQGVLTTGAAASAEALIGIFQKKVSDPSDPKDPGKLYPVKGIVDYNELSALVSRGNRTGNALVPTLIQFYDAEDKITTVSRTYGIETALEPFACAVTTSQPKALAGLITKQDVESGFMNRWFFASGKEKPQVAIGEVTPDHLPLVAPLKEVQGWAASSGGRVEWSQDAKEAFEEFFKSQIEPAVKADETSLLSRLSLFCKKLILLFTANMLHVQVMPEAIEQLKHIFPYILECYGITNSQIGNTLQDEIRLALLESIAKHQTKHPEGPTKRDINRRYLSRRKYPQDLLLKTIKNMVELEEITEVTALPPGGVGRPTTRYTVSNPEAVLDFVANPDSPTAGGF